MDTLTVVDRAGTAELHTAAVAAVIAAAAELEVEDHNVWVCSAGTASMSALYWVPAGGGDKQSAEAVAVVVGGPVKMIEGEDRYELGMMDIEAPLQVEEAVVHMMHAGPEGYKPLS
jgi:hypothetical protein